MRPEEVIGKTVAEMKQLETDGELDWPACWPIVENGRITGIVRAGDTIEDDELWFDPETDCYRRDAGEDLPELVKFHSGLVYCPQCGLRGMNEMIEAEGGLICPGCRCKFRLG